jgi:hypothetical protein
VPPGIQQLFVPPRAAGAIEYVPMVLGSAFIAFADTKLGIVAHRDVLYAAPFTNDAVPVDWANAIALDVKADALSRAPADGASFQSPPTAALQPKNYAVWEKALSRWLMQSEKLELFRVPALKLVSRPDESERDFRVRLLDAVRASRDEAVDGVRKKYATKQAALQDRLRRAEAAVGRESEQASQQKLQTAVSMGATLLGAILGRKSVSTSTLGRATTTARGMGRSMKEAGDVKRAQEEVGTLRQQIADLDARVAEETAAIAAGYDANAPLDTTSIAPKRGQVTVQFVALGWVPSDRLRA